MKQQKEPSSVSLFTGRLGKVQGTGARYSQKLKFKLLGTYLFLLKGLEISVSRLMCAWFLMPLRYSVLALCLFSYLLILSHFSPKNCVEDNAHCNKFVWQVSTSLSSDPWYFCSGLSYWTTSFWSRSILCLKKLSHTPPTYRLLPSHIPNSQPGPAHYLSGSSQVNPPDPPHAPISTPKSEPISRLEPKWGSCLPAQCLVPTWLSST